MAFLLQINMMLASLYKKTGQERSSVTSYKEVLRQCPLALDAILGSSPLSSLCCLSPLARSKVGWFDIKVWPSVKILREGMLERFRVSIMYFCALLSLETRRLSAGMVGNRFRGSVLPKPELFWLKRPLLGLLRPRWVGFSSHETLKPGLVAFSCQIKPAFVSLDIVTTVCPHLGLLSLSVKGAEVASLSMNVIQSIPNLDWLSVWIKAYAFVHTGDNTRAINTIW